MLRPRHAADGLVEVGDELERDRLPVAHAEHLVERRVILGAQRDEHVLNAEPVDKTRELGDGGLGRPGRRDLDGPPRERVAARKPLGDRR